jgi:hypothetical protein
MEREKSMEKEVEEQETNKAERTNISYGVTWNK